MEKDDLLKLLGDDEFGLLNLKSKAASTVDERLLASFEEINSFYQKNDRAPESNVKDVIEHKLFSRLKSLRKAPEKVEALKPYDKFGLLNAVAGEKQITSITDIFEDDTLGILSDEADDIFKLRNVPASINMPEKIAQRKPCKDFAEFEPLFKLCHAELLTNVREARAFTGEQQIKAGHFFILHGVMAYVAEVGEKETKNGKVNARLRCIFENGTESNMLLRSLATELYKDDAGRRILDPHDKALEELSFIKGEDMETGFIYVLRSLSERPEIKGMKDLYKIGFSTQAVEDRIKLAEQLPTYLMAPVKIVDIFQCYNLNPQKLELLLHTFFGTACLDIDIFDNDGKRHSPREWFIAPLHIIAASIKLIENGEIIHYRYDKDSTEIVLR